ncbi:MFS transporter [Chloroflexota bacterium]
MVIACFFIGFYQSGAIFYGFTAIFKPIVNEFGWSYAQISLASSLRGIEMGILAPFLGLAVDRWGPRRIMFIGSISLSMGLLLLSRTTSLAMFYGAFTLFALGFSCCGGIVPLTAVANWFRKRIGIATGIMISGYGLGGLLIPLVTKLVDILQWRTSVLILGLGMLLVGLPLSLLVRHKPEKYGYLPDGDSSIAIVQDDGLTSILISKLNISTRQVLKSRTFRTIALAVISQQTILMAVLTHVMPYLSTIGVTRYTSSLVASAIPIVSIGGRLSFGWISDRFDKRFVFAAGFALINLGMLFFGYASGATMLLIPFLILFGTGYGGNNTTRVSLMRAYIGQGNFGTIMGLLMGLGSIGNIVGAPLAGWVFDSWGNYQPIWFVFSGLAFAAFILILTTPPINMKH